MRVLRLEAEFEYDDEMMHGGDADAEAKRWFFEKILGSSTDLALYSSEIGDEIGKFRVVRLIGGGDAG